MNALELLSKIQQPWNCRPIVKAIGTVMILVKLGRSLRLR